MDFLEQTFGSARDGKEGREKDTKDRDRDRDRRDKDRDRGRERRDRSRDRGRRSKSRDRRSRKKSTRSSSPSPEKERKKKTSSWDQGPGGVPAPPVSGFNVFGIPNIGIPVSVRHIAPPDPKKARTVYVGGVTGDVTERVLRDFFEHRIPQVPNRPPSQGRIIDNVQINSEKMYAFVEFFNFVDADIAMCFDGVKLGSNQIRIRRPTNYTPPAGQQNWSISGVLSTQVPDGPNKIFLGNLPTTMTDVEVQMLASAFGELQAFTLITDRATGVSKGYAFMCYKDASVTNAACAGLNGQELGGKRLACKTANQKSAMDAVAALNGLGGGNPFAGFGLDGPQPTPMLMMENMVTPGELEDLGEFEDILEDIEQECRKHGNLVKVVIPRVQDVTTDYSRLIAADVGKIFVKYHDVDSAVVARGALNGRKFNDRTIVINFITSEDWERKGLN